MDEFALIEHYFRSLPGTNSSSVPLGIGDDCALLTIPAGNELAVSIDTLVEGVHFPKGAAGRDVATRAFCTALSDLAAMGAEPLWVTLALTLPKVDEPWVRGFSEALGECLARFNCALVGGDTTRGPLTLSVQVHGQVPAGKALKRSGAQVGDGVYVSNTLGNGAAALALILGELDVPAEPSAELKKHFYAPVPQVALGQWLRGRATSAIDVSDGLLADAQHIARASGVGVVLNLDSLPLVLHEHKFVAQQQALQWGLTGGDDYQLLFTAPKSFNARQALAQNFKITPIGDVIAGEGIQLMQNAQPILPQALGLNVEGFNHFGG